MSEAPPTPPVQQVHLTAIEAHPDGKRLRLTEHVYLGSAFYGPALTALLPGAAPVRRLDYEVLPDQNGVRQRRAVWLLQGDGAGKGWYLPARLPEEFRPWAELALAPEPPARPHWQRRSGWSALMHWLDTELSEQCAERLGVPQVIKDWGISFLARTETTIGGVYLKAVPDFFRTEVAVTCTLSRELPGAAAPVLAADTRLGLMLLQDAGTSLDNGASGWSGPGADSPAWTLDQSRALLRQVARVQRGAERLPLLASLPDHGPEWVMRHLPKLLGGALFMTGQPDGLTPEEAGRLVGLRPRVEVALSRLAASPVPRTLGHGDLHEGNVLVQEGRYTLLDWSDASVTHPFLDGGPQYLVPEDQREEATETYLKAWTDLLPLPELRSLLADGVLAGELYRVLGYTEGIQPYVADDDWHTAHLYHFRALLRLADLP